MTVLTTHRAYYLGCLFFVLAIAGFYYMQNQPNQIGGAISLPKACWLGLALFYWYFLPPLLIAEKGSKNRTFYAGLSIFFASMLLRAVVELYLMYGKQTWHYYYGISHNFLSLIILLMLSFNTRKVIEKPLKVTLYLMIIMFIAEIYFASYMTFAIKDGYQKTIWFVDSTEKHLVNNTITAIMVMLLILWQVIFYQQWIKKNMHNVGKQCREN